MLKRLYLASGRAVSLSPNVPRGVCKCGAVLLPSRCLGLRPHVRTAPVLRLAAATGPNCALMFIQMRPKFRVGCASAELSYPSQSAPQVPRGVCKCGAGM